MSAPTRALTHETVDGWPTWVLRQGRLTLRVVPSVGGRLMGIDWDGRPLCFVHPDLRGQTDDGDPARWQALCGAWDFPLWGGGKTWIGPEGDWPDGAPHRDLDSGAWAVTATWCDAASMGIDLCSPVCSVTGLQLARCLHWAAGEDAWTVRHELRNRGTQTLRRGLWDVLMLRRPAEVRVPLPAMPDADAAVLALPGKPSCAALAALGVLQPSGTDGAPLARVVCDRGLGFKLGFASAEGAVEVALPACGARYVRHAAVNPAAAYAHGRPVEVFNAPALDYFEVETHGPLATLAPGEAVQLLIHERVAALVPA